jgi:hypothetical protein
VLTAAIAAMSSGFTPAQFLDASARYGWAVSIANFRQAQADRQKNAGRFKLRAVIQPQACERARLLTSLVLDESSAPCRSRGKL